MINTFDKSKVRILIVDDEPSLRELIQTALKEDGWSVDTAENGKLAFEKISQSPFHIVLSDIQMPEMTGIELLEAAKKSHPHIEFVIMTSNATLDTAVKALKAGAYDYLNKPFEDILVVPKKMTHVAEKILLRQQNAELLKRLKKASQDLKRLFDFTSSLNGILDEEALQKAVLAGLPQVFQQPDVRAVWFAEENQKWVKRGMIPADDSFQITPEFKDPSELLERTVNGRILRLQKFPREGNPKHQFIFEDLGNSISDIFLEEVLTCYSKVEMHQDILSMANRDGLTRLYNHRYFQDRIRQELATVQRQNAQMSLILMDVDHFKNYNDSNGHPAGDKILKQLALILDPEEGKRVSDITARYGGEEFVMLLPFTPYDGALIKAERIRKAVEDFEFDHREKQPLKKVTLSIGVATYPDHAKLPVDLIEAADQSLYQAKHGGRNRVVGFADILSGVLKKVEPRESITVPPPLPESTGGKPTLASVLETADKPEAEAPLISVEEEIVEMELPEPVEEVQEFDINTFISSIDSAIEDAKKKEIPNIETVPFGDKEPEVESEPTSPEELEKSLRKSDGNPST
ncbi:MAG: diguanylate cyclase [Deltaproteobacteria bacterium]|nr:diguanylate cyclase [Deltaproteobacteria bacterium]